MEGKERGRKGRGGNSPQYFGPEPPLLIFT